MTMGTTSPPTAGTTGTAKQEAAEIGQTTKEAGVQVVTTAKDEARNVVDETRNQARDLLQQTRSQLQDQAATQKTKAAGGLRSLGDELRSLARGEQPPGGSGQVSGLADQAADAVHQLASWLDAKEPGQLLDEVRDLARRRPGAFLLGAAAAGVLAGRLTRGAVDASRSEPSESQPAGGVLP